MFSLNACFFSVCQPLSPQMNRVWAWVREYPQPRSSKKQAWDWAFRYMTNHGLRRCVCVRTGSMKCQKPIWWVCRSNKLDVEYEAGFMSWHWGAHILWGNTSSRAPGKQNLGWKPVRVLLMYVSRENGERVKEHRGERSQGRTSCQVPISASTMKRYWAWLTQWSCEEIGISCFVVDKGRCTNVKVFLNFFSPGSASWGYTGTEIGCRFGQQQWDEVLTSRHSVSIWLGCHSKWHSLGGWNSIVYCSKFRRMQVWDQGFQ